MATARKTAAGKTARSPSRARRNATRTLSALDSLAQLQTLKADLEAVSEKLNGIDPAALDAAAHERWSHQLDRVDLAIARARTALLLGLSAAFEAELPELQGATTRLADSLARLQAAARIIETVAGVLGVIERVITLGRSG